MPENTPVSARPQARSFDRRTLVRTTAWGVPAIAVASAAPAFAVSYNPDECVPAAVVSVGWRLVSGQINQNGSTGWQLGTQPKAGTSLEGAYLSGDGVTGESRWFTSEPVGSFISFANNARNDIPAVIEVTYEFNVTGSATLTLANELVMGYGDPNANTERQTLEVVVIDGNSRTTTSKIGHKRIKGAQQLPTGSIEADLQRSEALLIRDGYTLEEMPSSGRHTRSIPGTPVVVASNDPNPRPVQVVYRVTLDPLMRPGGVNDDLILNPPTVASC